MPTLHIILISYTTYEFADQPLTLPLIDEKLFAQGPRVIARFRDTQAGKNIKEYL